MLLKVGDLARRTGLTVRTLHHYDEIGLLQPSGRTDAGYRLYSPADVRRLHGIQALRHLGLALADIAGLLSGEGIAPDEIMGQQILALDQQIQQATELRGRLALMRDGLLDGTEPEMGKWLETLALMATYGKYFSAAELRRILGKWRLIEAEWTPLKALVRHAMDRGLTPDSAEVQGLAYRWMALMLYWMDGDMDLLDRWGEMYRQEPSAHGLNHAPASDMIEFVDRAVKLRLALIEKYLSRDELRRLGYVPYTQWAALETDVQQLLRDRVPAGSAQSQAAAARWNALLDTLCANDPGLRHKLLTASASEPLLAAGSALSEPVRRYLRESLSSKVLDPHAT